MSVPKVADELKLNKTTVYRWLENNRDFKREAMMARLDAVGEYTAEINSILGETGVWMAAKFAVSIKDDFDDLTPSERLKAMEWLTKNFKVPEQRTTHRETRSVEAKISYRQDAPASEPIEGEATEIDGGDDNDGPA